MEARCKRKQQAYADKKRCVRKRQIESKAEEFTPHQILSRCNSSGTQYELDEDGEEGKVSPIS